MSQIKLSGEYICSEKNKNFSVVRYHLDPWPSRLPVDLRHYVSEVWAILDQGERRNALDKNFSYNFAMILTSGWEDRLRTSVINSAQAEYGPNYTKPVLKFIQSRYFKMFIEFWGCEVKFNSIPF